MTDFGLLAGGTLAAFAIGDWSSAMTPEHMALVGGVIVGMVSVIKGYQWVDHEVDRKIDRHFQAHNEADQARHETLKAEIRALHEVIHK